MVIALLLISGVLYGIYSVSIVKARKDELGGVFKLNTIVPSLVALFVTAVVFTLIGTIQGLTTALIVLVFIVIDVLGAISAGYRPVKRRYVGTRPAAEEKP